jgi:hypothetical protein
VKPFSTVARLAATMSLALFAVTACGGGGGGSGSNPPTPPPPPGPSVTGDMLAYQQSRGWNYHGTAFGGQAVTFSVYADPAQSGVEPLILFGGLGTAATAFSGNKLGGIGVQNTASGYVVGSYVLLNNDGSVYAQGGLTGTPLLVPATLTLGQSFSTYPGVTAVVQAVGTVPGSAACPTPATGATVAYTFAGQSYTVSYVPGCGITQYTGNHGEVLTLSSVGSYPQLGTQSTRRMNTLTAFDTLASAARVLATHAKWSPSWPRLP